MALTVDSRPSSAQPDATRPVTPARGLLRPGWPLVALYLGFPLWWLLGVSHFVFIALSIPMAVELLRRRPVLTPPKFGVWLLFLAWMTAGVFVLWAHAPGTIDDGGLMRIIPFAYRACWYLAITVVLLYVINLSERELPAMKVSRLLGFMFVVCAIGGLAGLLLPRLDFPSLMEVLLPKGATSQPFLQSLMHPSLSTPSGFLGYEQARPVAPFAFANAWGNNLSLFLPFFVHSWMGKNAGWRRILAPLVLAGAAIPVVYSLNRGVWLGLCVAAVYVSLRFALMGRLKALYALVAGVLLVGIIAVATPLGQTVVLRLETPHSNERRGDVATTVIDSAWEGSPLVGFGTTRQVQGSFSSVAGGSTPDCHQCGAPPLGTQGFMWRLVFTTGFVGTVLFLGFLAVQFFHHVRSPGRYALLGTTMLLMSGVFFLVYDSLESPLFTLMIAIGLMYREKVESHDG